MAFRVAHGIRVEAFKTLDASGVAQRTSPPDRDPTTVPRGPRHGGGARGARGPLEQLLAWASPLEGARALEIGCGDGTLGAALAAGGAQVTTVDLDPALIAQARRRIARDELGYRMTAQVMPLKALDFPDDGFDLVVGRAALDRADLDACRHEIARVLRPGGTAVLIEPVCLSPTVRALAQAAARPLAPPHGSVTARPLEDHELRSFLDRFEEVERAYFALTGQVAGRSPLVQGALSRWERWLLDRFPSMRAVAGLCVLRARKAAPSGGGGMAAWG